MKIYKRFFAAFSAAIIAGSLLPADMRVTADEGDILPENDSGFITIYPDKEPVPISPYIYGFNDKGDIDGIHGSVIKQSGAELSSYNWETNYANGGTDGHNRHTIYPERVYSAVPEDFPGKLAENLYARSLVSGSEIRLLTLQMMGFAAADGSGVVTSDALSKNTRWKQVLFSKEDTYLNQPDTSDNYVYMDEYVSYLVNRYGAAEEGGISGYFLDSEPDKWAERFSVLGLEKITPGELVERSAQLASSVKTIDSGALVFGPSVSGLQGCINLNNADAWSSRTGADKEYSWFIDYYLDFMRRKENESGVRLLDVLDVHYFTEATTPMGSSVLTGTDDEARAYRMQSVRTLWDSDYTENSPTVLLNKQFTPLIPTLNASIRINYPGTRLSFSEYDFGGGDDMSGAIAQIDALGTFAREGVYMACLSPASADNSFQKAALRLFGNYDGRGGSFGSRLLLSENNGDSMNSAYAAADSDNPETIRVIITNKNLNSPQNMEIDLQTVRYSYTVTEAYTIDENADIIPCDNEMFASDMENIITFEAAPFSAYMLVLSGNEEQSEFTTVTPSDTENPMETPSAANTETSTVNDSTILSDTSVSSETFSETEGSVTEEISETSVTTVTNETFPSEVSLTETQVTEAEARSGGVAAPVKAVVTALAAAVGLGVVYVLFFDRKRQP